MVCTRFAHLSRYVRAWNFWYWEKLSRCVFSFQLGVQLKQALTEETERGREKCKICVLCKGADEEEAEDEIKSYANEKKRKTKPNYVRWDMDRVALYRFKYRDESYPH